MEGFEDFFQGFEDFFHIVIDPGNVVLCDYCNDEFTDSDETGGFLFGRKAVCPHCQERLMRDIKKYNEEHYIRGYCPEGISFADWIRSIR